MSPKMKNALENAGIANAAQVADSNRPISAQKEICQKLCIWRGRKNRCIWRENWWKILLTLHCYEYTFRTCSMSKRYFKLRPEHLQNPSYLWKVGIYLFKTASNTRIQLEVLMALITYVAMFLHSLSLPHGIKTTQRWSTQSHWWLSPVFLGVTGYIFQVLTRRWEWLGLVGKEWIGEKKRDDHNRGERWLSGKVEGG